MVRLCSQTLVASPGEHHAVVCRPWRVRQCVWRGQHERDPPSCAGPLLFHRRRHRDLCGCYHLLDWRPHRKLLPSTVIIRNVAKQPLEAFITDGVERAINEGFGNDMTLLIASRTVRGPRVAVVAPNLASYC
jgi:hypothetical protein